MSDEDFVLATQERAENRHHRALDAIEQLRTVGRRELDRECGKGPGGVYLEPECHPGATWWARYDHGFLILECPARDCKHRVRMRVSVAD